MPSAAIVFCGRREVAPWGSMPTREGHVRAARLAGLDAMENPAEEKDAGFATRRSNDHRSDGVVTTDEKPEGLR